MRFKEGDKVRFKGGKERLPFVDRKGKRRKFNNKEIFTVVKFNNRIDLDIIDSRGREYIECDTYEFIPVSTIELLDEIKHGI